MINEVYAVFTTGTDYYDRPELFAIFSTPEKAEAAADALREQLEDEDCAEFVGQRLYEQVTVSYAQVR